MCIRDSNWDGRGVPFPHLQIMRISARRRRWGSDSKETKVSGHCILFLSIRFFPFLPLVLSRLCTPAHISDKTEQRFFAFPGDSGAACLYLKNVSVTVPDPGRENCGCRFPAERFFHNTEQIDNRFRRDEPDNRCPGELFNGIPGHVCETGIDILQFHAAYDCDPIACSFCYDTVFLLAFPECFFNPLPVGYIPDIFDHTGYMTMRISKGKCPDFAGPAISRIYRLLF